MSSETAAAAQPFFLLIAPPVMADLDLLSTSTTRGRLTN